MTCDYCKLADWKRTSNGRLHPGKSGRCTRLDRHPIDTRLPAAFYWLTPPVPSGGYIERGKPHRAPCIFKDGSR